MEMKSNWLAFPTISK